MTIAPQSIQPKTAELRRDDPNAEIVEILAEMGRDGDGACEVAARVIVRLTERCEQYKGQVKAGSDEIDALKARVLEMEGEATSYHIFWIEERTKRQALEDALKFYADGKQDYGTVARSALSPDGNSGEGK